ncbi:hypothetical protein D3C86_2065950 [compost metagenome]
MDLSADLNELRRQGLDGLVQFGKRGLVHGGIGAWSSTAFSTQALAETMTMMRQKRCIICNIKKSVLPS